MPSIIAILRSTGAATTAAMVGVWGWATVSGHALPHGFFAACVLILVELVALVVSVRWIERALLAGAAPGLGVMVLVGRLPILLLAVGTIASVWGIGPTAAGVMFTFTVLTVASVLHAVPFLPVFVGAS